MKNINTSSKKGKVNANQALVEQYKSQSSRVSSNEVKPKESIMMQNMKEFKCQIDHQIAKCLDTLDRQGLKFLKQTLRASTLFGLHTQELANTHSIQQNIVFSQQMSPPKPQIIKKIEPIRQKTQNNVQIKKITKPQIPKNNPVSSKEAKGTDEKNNLAQKINKKLQNLQIKSGKKNDSKKQNPKIDNISNNKKMITVATPQIAEQIQIQQIEKEQKTYSSNKQSDDHYKEKRVIKTQQKQTINQYQASLKRQVAFNTEVKQQSNQYRLAKPFNKNPFKRPQQTKYSQKKTKKDQANQVPKQLQVNSLKQPQILKYQVTNNQIMQNTKNQLKYNPKQQQNQQQHQIDKQKPKQIDSQLQNLIKKINKLSPNKRMKLQKIIQKLEDSKKDQVSISMISENKSNQESYLKPFIPPRGSFLKKSQAKQHNKSRSKLEKHQKATSLQNSIVTRKVYQNSTPDSHKLQNQSKIEVSLAEQKDFLQNSNKNYAPNQINAVSQIISQQKLVIVQKNKISQKQSELSNYMSESSQKFIKINKRKTVTNTLSINILSNNGHPTLVGLSSLKLFNQASQIIAVDQSNVKTNPKILKLFSQNLDEGWYTSLSNSMLIIQSISQPIAVIRIINLNKSQLQNNKQANLIEIHSNNELVWRGNLKGGSFKQNQYYITDINLSGKKIELPAYKITDEQSKQWLQKQIIDRKMKQLAEMQKSDNSIKKIQNIRNSNTSLSLLKQQIQIAKSIKQQVNLPNEEAFKKEENLSNLSQNREKLLAKSQLKALDNDDVIGLLSKQIENKKKISTYEDPQFKKKQSQYLIVQKQKSHDQQFDQILMSMQKRQKRKEDPVKYSIDKQEDISNQSPVNKKSLAEKSLEDFMNDSLFNDKPKPKIRRAETNQFRKQQLQYKKQEYSNNFVQQKHETAKDIKDIDNFIDELNDMIGPEGQDQTGQQFYIPQLPKGSQLGFNILSNWGNQSFVGINAIQIFDSNGVSIKPSSLYSNSVNTKQLNDKLFKQELLTSDQKMQMKIAKNKKISFSFKFSQKIELAALRIWNYNGQRVHNNIGVKKCHIKLDGKYIFSGQIQQSSGSFEDAYKYCEYILFTENQLILKKIKDKDWLSRLKLNLQEQNILFKTTLQNFHRPVTRNDEQAIKKPVVQQIKKELIKLPKKQCFQYDPPLMPQGFVLKFIIHSSWGDRFFVGLNGIQVFNEKGQNITNTGLLQIKADPSSISKLQGYEKDKRVVSNLINGKNNTVSDDNIWLAPLLSDVQKIQKGRANTIIMEYKKTNKISGINFYNYTKTPERGVKQVQIFMDNYLLYRGYLRRYSAQQAIVHTSINFTKQQSLLEAMGYIGYNQDHLEQEVGLINEQKIIRSAHLNLSSQKQMNRPKTGKIFSEYS